MIKLSKINIKIIKVEHELGESILKFNINGDNINFVVMNTIRRTIFSDIPIYAFSEIIIDKSLAENRSIFHNNFINLDLTNFPVWGIENNIDFIDNDDDAESLTQQEEVHDDDDDDIDNNGFVIHPDEVPDNENNINSLNELTMYVNYKNKTTDNITITTDHAKFYYKQNQIDSPYNNPSIITKLNANKEISFSAITKIGTEEKNGTMYSAVSICCYKEITNNEFEFELESRGQITEFRIIHVAIINIKKKLKNFLKLVQNIKEINNDTNFGEIIINNEDHTLGNLISRGMQFHNKISFAGYNKPHPLIKKIILHYNKKNKSDSIIDIIQDVVQYYIELYNEILNQIKKKMKNL